MKLINDGKIDGAIHIPMGDLINHLGEIPKGEKSFSIAILVVDLKIF